MPLPILRRSNSQRTREHRRSYKKYPLGLQLLCLCVVCISTLWTVYELVELARTRTVQWSSLHSNHLRFQGSEESNKPRVERVERVEVAEASHAEVGSIVGPVFFSENALPHTFGQRLSTFFAPWIASSEVKLPLQVPVQADTDDVDSGCKLDGAASSPGPEIPRVFLKCWKPPKRCGTAEEMGSVAAGNTSAASLQIRGMIMTWMRGHGAEVVRDLSGSEFCERKFVMGLAFEDGFGNNMYKVLSAAGLALMLNRSLIIGT
jgi:hypothetical protein